MKKNWPLPTGTQKFKDLIEHGGIYVDKTAYLARLIASVPKTWFLTRPRYFGKSLTVSTLESIFSGQRELFKGLAIEKNLDQKQFAPRPVIHLDMSKLTISQGPEIFYDSLNEATKKLCESLNIDVSECSTASSLFSALIRECSETYGNQVAVLIDEYDTPYTQLLDKPDEAEKMSKTLNMFYRRLKVYDGATSFVFVTGITRVVMDSALNNRIDISRNQEFGALTGFTHEEIKRYFGKAIKHTAKSRKLTDEELLEEMKRNCDGGCFDRKTFVYNPFSTLRFFEQKTF
ncbi:MAG: AAA family ATPase [Deltaproteobacteria bacterium]|nr:AAA family ATPase [Deltaproteobacteria bacterium]